MSFTYQQKKQEIKDFCLERLREIAEYMDNQDFRDSYVSDLHNDIFNTDYYIIGHYQAKEWMGADAFDMIGDVQEMRRMSLESVIQTFLAQKALPICGLM